MFYGVGGQLYLVLMAVGYLWLAAVGAAVGLLVGWVFAVAGSGWRRAGRDVFRGAWMVPLIVFVIMRFPPAVNAPMFRQMDDPDPALTWPYWQRNAIEVAAAMTCALLVASHAWRHRNSSRSL